MPSTLEEPQVFGVPLAAGMTWAEPMPDGTVVVRDVPLFAEIKPDDQGVVDGMRTPRDREWLERTVAKTQARIASGYKPPMTLRHHFDDPQRVGTFVPKKVVLATVNPGEPPRPTIIGDKVYESQAAFDASKDHDYRSIELSPDDVDEITGLALLRDKAPFFKFPSLVERLKPEERDGFVRDAFKARASVAPQLWAARPEVFMAVATAPLNFGDAKSPYAVANAMANKGQITKSRVADFADAIKSKDHETKEGDMPGDTKDTSATVERMEACLAKFEAMMTSLSKFEALMDKKGESTANAETKAAGGTEAPEKTDLPRQEKLEEDSKKAAAEKHAGEHQASHGPDAVPAISQARPPAQVVPEAFSAKIEVQETAILGLRAELDKMRREKAAVALVAEGRRALGDMGITSPSEAFEARMHAAAVSGGKQGVDALLADVKLTMGMSSRAPEAFGVFGQTPAGVPATSTAFDSDVKAAVEAFGARPEVKSRILALASDFRSQMGEHAIRSIAPGEFFQVCEGTGSINPDAGTVEYYRRKERLRVAAASANGKGN